jgi:hypothetical protein
MLISGLGGQKITEEYVDPIKQRQVLDSLLPGQDPNDYRYLFAKHWETTGFSPSVGGGLDMGLNRAFAVSLINVDYTRSWLARINGNDFTHGLRVGTGLVLRLGTW